ncbi:MAG: hypothetical protein L6R41_000725 [Letrouitia leprolyta]|nr:MAG: hypothetical protein L6R41_000725 [Letrouitia leprolyta]
MPPTLEPETSAESEAAGILPSHGISIDIPGHTDTRPQNIRHTSLPAYESPLRHHVRHASSAKPVKETLHARSEYTNSKDDGAAVHRINQYIVKQEIGRGSFGAVHLAVDQHGNEYAVKEFSKSRLRKRAQSNVLRSPHHVRKPGHLAAGLGFNSPLHRHSASDDQDKDAQGNSLYLIKEEIAIMKKLNHDNVVSLIEVLDDPDEDSLYMVLEMCKKGVIMKVGVDETADPYDEELCRYWFRDLILGIEYLHAQGVVHRDIKPDNCLLTQDNVLKVVDFGVSEMFEKSSEMRTAKSAGSPAFMPPELCVAKHGDISGKAADIWSMGITLYCLRFGKIPFEKPGVLQLYECIRNEPLSIGSELGCSDNLRDLIIRLLEKDPRKRITMEELREHPWVTKNGDDPLLSKEENTANLIEPPTEEETNNAITGNLGNVMVLMKAVKAFKRLIERKKPGRMSGILGRETRLVQPPSSMLRDEQSAPRPRTTRSVDTADRRPVEQALAAEGIHRDPDISSIENVLSSHAVNVNATTSGNDKSPRTDRHDSAKTPTSPTSKRDIPVQPKDHRPKPSTMDDHGRGHAHNPLEDHLFLAVGPYGSDEPPDPPAVSESPAAAETNIYETAYSEEIERIRSRSGTERTLYLTRRVEKQEQFRNDQNLVGRDDGGDEPPKGGLGKILGLVRKKDKQKDDDAIEQGPKAEGKAAKGQ